MFIIYQLDHFFKFATIKTNRMKKLNIIAFFIIYLIFSACFENNSNIFSELETIDYLIRNNKRDSARILFDSIDTTLATKKDYALYNLLKIRQSDILTYNYKWDSMLNTSEYYFKKINDKKYISEIYLKKAQLNIYFKEEYDSIAYYLFKAEKLATEINDYYILAQIYWTKPTLYYLTKDYTKIKECVQLELLNATKSGNQRQIAYATLNMATAYRNISQNDSATIYLNAALLLDKYLLTKDISFIYNTLGELSMDKNQNIARQDFEKAIEISPTFLQAKLNIAKLHLLNNQINQAEKMCIECLNTNETEEKISALKILCQCKEAEGNFKEALEIQKKIMIQDSTMKKLDSNRNILKYIHQNTDNKKTNINNWISLFLFILCIVLTIGIVKSKKTLKKQIALTNDKEIMYHTSNNECSKLKNEIDNLKQNNQNYNNTISNLKNQLEQLTQKQTKYQAVGKKLYEEIVNNNAIIKWSTTDMVNFIEYYRILKAEFINNLDMNYTKLTPRYKIILILEDMGKTINEIKKIMSFEETSYYSAKSRINNMKR